MKIRKATLENLDEILNIYVHARSFMESTGNPHQWGRTKPKRETVKQDIMDQNSYLIEEDGTILGAFSFILGSDETYNYIEGNWLNDNDYGVIHRIASSGMKRGILNECLKFCMTKTDNIRIDTHEDNKIMQLLLEKNNFQRCGTIYLKDGSPRIAYQKYLNK